MATNIAITDLTSGSLGSDNEWSGTGVFDKLIEAVNKNIEGQYNLGRINGSDYANVYLGSMQSVIAQSMQYLLQEKQVEAQIDKLKEETAYQKLEQQALYAKIRDEHETEISTSDDPVQVTDPKTMHYSVINKAKSDAETAKENIALTKSQVEVSELSMKKMLVELKADYNAYNVDKVVLTDVTTGEEVPIGVDGVTVQVSTDGELVPYRNGELDTNIKVDTKVSELTGYSDLANLLNTEDVITNYLPKSRFEAEMLKARVESNIGINTAKGYEGDAYYKQYRSLQELFFALGNAQIEVPEDGEANLENTSNANNIYAKVIQGMEKALNNNTDVWDDDDTKDIKLTADNNTSTDSGTS